MRGCADAGLTQQDGDLPGRVVALRGDRQGQSSVGTVGQQDVGVNTVWLNAIKQGRFSFGPATVTYVNQGEGSWKMQALGVDPDDESDVEFTFTDTFLASDWKHFHDAVQHHRLFILHNLLPRFGLCAP